MPSAEEKLAIVQEYYKSAYRIEFPKLLPYQADYLYEQMQKLKMTLHEYYKERPLLQRNLLELRGVLKDPLKKRKIYE